MKSNPAAEIEKLKRLTQQAATWLLGWKDAKSLRDRVDAPRNADGSYDAQALCEWRRGQVKEIDGDDGEFVEKVLVLVDGMSFPDTSDARALSFLDQVRELHRKYGDSFYAMFMREWLAIWADVYEPRRATAFEPVETEGEIRRRVADELKNQAEARSFVTWNVATQCDDCDAVRFGREWKKQPPPAGKKVQLSKCPACMQRWMDRLDRE